MITKFFYSIICIAYIFTCLAGLTVSAEDNKNEKQIVINETKKYKDTEIILEHLLISQDKTTLQIQLHGEQVKELIIKKKGDIYVHRTPKIVVFDDKGHPLKQGAKKEDEPDKGRMIQGRMHNISADTIELTNYYGPIEKLPEFIKIKVMNFNFNKGNYLKNNNSIAEFKVDL
ncbi:hypothetical protein F9U64_17875 [Gracilibacillus oryzae]|uniref:Uncharacterized protein n=1 Tax=Gracilibacillus oryzae TaxID=1672701 RepID=A0A7C8L1Q0_9BACI|nr:hypothetical protein [Gracilibacillus oryzae]KAB8127380.1 hypothetical protein F9U64_17875 [Gracilibacillus oryzae]